MSDAVATRRALRLANLLDDEWFAVGLQQDVTFGLCLVNSVVPSALPSAVLVIGNDDPAIPLIEAAECYCRLRRVQKGPTFRQRITGSIGYHFVVSGDKGIAEYERRDANLIRDPLRDKALAGQSIARPLGILRAISSPDNLQTALITIGARIVRLSCAITFRFAGVAVSRALFRRIRGVIQRLLSPLVSLGRSQHKSLNESGLAGLSKRELIKHNTTLSSQQSPEIAFRPCV